MITNWYTVNVSPEFLSDRLRAAYSMWLSSADLDVPPSLAELTTTKQFPKLTAYVVMLSSSSNSEDDRLICSQVGAKVNELFSADLEGLPFDDFLTDAGRSLAEEVIGLFNNANKPVHVRIANSAVIRSDVEIIVFPVAPGESGQDIAMMIYDY
jgi:hypothetical protein